MIRNIFFTLLVLSCFQAIGQSDFILMGKVIDKKSKEPLPYSTIIYQDKSIGTISNIDGYFNLSIYNAKESDSITISYVGYESFATTVAHCVQIKNFELKPAINEISEVVVEAEKFKLKSFIKEVISEYNNKRKEEAHIAISHYREKAKQNNHYIMYMESIGYSVYAGKQKSASPEWNYRFFCENTRCHVVNPKWITYKENRRVNNNQNVQPSPNSNLNIFRQFEYKGILSNKHCSNFNYNIDSIYDIGNRTVYLVSFTGKSSIGTMHIYADNKNLFKIECSTNNYRSTAFSKWVNAQVKIQFNYFNNTPFLSSIVANYEYNGLEYQNSLKVLTQKFNKFAISSKDYWSLSSYGVNPYIEYNPEEWKVYNIPDEIDYDSIKKDLESNMTDLEKQFEDYSGRWFFVDSGTGEAARRKIEELKNNF